MKERKWPVIATLLIVALAAIYIYFYELPVLANSSEFEVSNLDIQGDDVIVEVQSVDAETVFKKF